ncbi:TIGR03084 family protein [Nakamurella panacisegetis]|uniref:TIGR03084 family protein n=1 Tax=Nakamurella panacisegetis TaxID=1090615 RepID=A0A1H0Q6A9_9ACTN|nr:TIGR03084 family metal-binding protein [Nakamurella panacisegetis]SDP12169.1 TIGR03084 family protein [Nakamurella panacisegetis]
MAATTEELTLALIDLEAEGNQLDDLVSGDGVDLSTPTPSPGWTIAHQIGHLLWTDRITTSACRDPAGFTRQTEALGPDPHAAIDAAATSESGREAAELLETWRKGRSDLLNALYELPPDARIPWFGPPLGAAELASSRLMETWAHGLDVTDALGLGPVATPRLKHVAELGLQTRDFAFSLRGLRNPPSVFRVELIAPDGASWTWGPAKARDRISGPALDFCLLVTQRRHRDDLALVATDGPADQWLDIAQVFAGPVGSGRGPQAA